MKTFNNIKTICYLIWISNEISIVVFCRANKCTRIFAETTERGETLYSVVLLFFSSCKTQKLSEWNALYIVNCKMFWVILAFFVYFTSINLIFFQSNFERFSPIFLVLRTNYWTKSRFSLESKSCSICFVRIPNLSSFLWNVRNCAEKHTVRFCYFQPADWRKKAISTYTAKIERVVKGLMNKYF